MSLERKSSALQLRRMRWTSSPTCRRFRHRHRRERDSFVGWATTTPRHRAGVFKAGTGPHSGRSNLRIGQRFRTTCAGSIGRTAQRTHHSDRCAPTLDRREEQTASWFYPMALSPRWARMRSCLPATRFMQASTGSNSTAKQMDSGTRCERYGGASSHLASH